MPKDVGRDGFARQCRCVRSGRGDCPPHDVRSAETRETRPMRSDKERLRLIAVNPALAH